MEHYRCAACAMQFSAMRDDVITDHVTAHWIFAHDGAMTDGAPLAYEIVKPVIEVSEAGE